MIIKLENPNSKWLDIFFEHDDFKLDFVSSSIPNDPISDLISSLTLICQNVSSEMCWNCEPGLYFFQFEKFENLYKFSIFKKDESKELMYSVLGNFDQIILPFFRAIKKLYSLKFKESDWPMIENNKIEKLETAVKSNRTSPNPR